MVSSGIRWYQVVSGGISHKKQNVKVQQKSKLAEATAESAEAVEVVKAAGATVVAAAAATTT